ncbi:tyrosine--tRNA ligase [Candidatus Saccharibacteria bacterium]|nr:tyrosine--tRNA ligase [Candidatus Saccharibacteria bacterium]
MKLSEELVYRGFRGQNTFKDASELDERESKKFYFGADPSANSLTIGNLAAIMMCACFVRHGYEPYLLVGGATGQIGDPKDNGERELKPLEEVEANKVAIKKQLERLIRSDNLTMLDNLDWFRDVNYLDFLREVGKNFSMTQLLDRQFVEKRIGAGGSGISYAEFSYTLIQGYDFLHLYREKGISLELCGEDQFGNCSSGIHLIRVLENARADAWSTPLVIDPITGRKFGKSEGNAVWLDANLTSVFDFYQFFLNQSDLAAPGLLKIYTVLEPEEIDRIIAEGQEAPEKRLVQKALARGATAVVHGEELANKVEELSNILFDKNTDFSTLQLGELGELLTKTPCGKLVEIVTNSGLAESKKKAREYIAGGAISVNGEKITDENAEIVAGKIIKKGKNKFALTV